MSPWNTADTARDGRIVMTKIDDEHGARNEQALRRGGNLWFVPDGSMYVYYRPTHWRPLTVDERFAEAAKLKKSSATSRDALNRALESLEMEGKP